MADGTHGFGGLGCRHKRLLVLHTFANCSDHATVLVHLDLAHVRFSVDLILLSKKLHVSNWVTGFWNVQPSRKFIPFASTLGV